MSNNPFGSFEDVFEQGVSQVTNQVKKQVSDTAKATAAQVAGAAPGDTSHQATSHDATSQAVAATQSGPVSEDHSPENNTQPLPQTQDPTSASSLTPDVASLEANAARDQQEKLVQTRAQLKAHNQQHKNTYFDPTFNPPKKEQPVAERLEQEKMQEEQKKMQELEEQKKKDEPIALARAKRTTEMNRGASG